MKGGAIWHLQLRKLWIAIHISQICTFDTILDKTKTIVWEEHIQMTGLYRENNSSKKR